MLKTFLVKGNKCSDSALLKKIKITTENPEMPTLQPGLIHGADFCDVVSPGAFVIPATMAPCTATPLNLISLC